MGLPFKDKVVRRGQQYGQFLPSRIDSNDHRTIMNMERPIISNATIFTPYKTNESSKKFIVAKVSRKSVLPMRIK
jgi:hypothetical protein